MFYKLQKKLTNNPGFKVGFISGLEGGEKE